MNNKISKHIALYFGSFNPVHNGHLRLAEFLTENKMADEVWFVVSPCNPLKKRADLLDEYIRLEMLLLAIKGNESLKASDVEFTMPVPSYTYDTLQVLRNQFPDCQFSLIIGSDNALVFQQWKNFRQILNEYPVYVYPRSGYEFKEVAEQYPQMKLLSTPLYEISSTEIRDNIRKKKDVSQWLHPDVYAFIRENEFYCE